MLILMLAASPERVQCSPPRKEQLHIERNRAAESAALLSTIDVREVWESGTGSIYGCKRPTSIE